MTKNSEKAGDGYPYETFSAHQLFDVTRSVIGREVKQGDTITFISEVDLTQIEEIRSNWKDGKKPTYTSFIAKSVALALKEFPYANRRLYRLPWLPFSGSRLQTFKTIDVAVACERDEPNLEVAAFIDILRDADSLKISEITTWLHSLATCDISNNRQWRDYYSLVSKVPSWLSSLIISLPVFSPKFWWKWRGGSVIISSPAKYGVDIMVGAWPAPLGVSFGLAKDRPVVNDGKIEIRRTFFLTLNWDRRVMAGAQAAKFFKRLIDILENPLDEISLYLK